MVEKMTKSNIGTFLADWKMTMSNVGTFLAHWRLSKFYVGSNYGCENDKVQCRHIFGTLEKV